MPSSRPRTLLLIATHIAALALGIVLFRSLPDNDESSPESTATSSAAHGSDTASDAEAVSTKRPNHPAPSLLKASPHLVAWKALAADDLTRPERMKASAELLREWIKDDWQGALDTMMKETPDDFALLVEFQPCFASHADEVWTLIETKRYGILTKDLRNQWVGAVQRLDEDRIRQLAATLPDPGKKVVQEILDRKKSS